MIRIIGTAGALMIVDWDTLLPAHPMLGFIPGHLRSAARLRPFDRGQTLYCRGERPVAMLYVLAGEVRLMRHSVRGGELILQRVRSGFIAEASLEASAYHCDVIAAANGRLIAFPMEAFRRAVDGEGAFGRAWMSLLAREVRRLRAQSERLVLNCAAERIIHFLESEAEDGVVMLTQPRKAWAAELGLSHEVLYRTLRRLRDEGVLSIEGERLALVRAERPAQA